MYSPPVLARAELRGVSPTRVQIPGAPGKSRKASQRANTLGILDIAQLTGRSVAENKHARGDDLDCIGKREESAASATRKKASAGTRTLSDTLVGDRVLDDTGSRVDDEPASLPDTTLHGGSASVTARPNREEQCD